jgi:ABC-type branched-subunit amino acid transport system ATPase component/ABC-type branched-subunit amino acid transport system permease subunit
MSQLATLWRHRVAGTAVRVALLFGAIPTAVLIVFSDNPPAGIFLRGMVLGGLYGLLAMGMVLVYRASKVINFAQASLGAAPAALALTLYATRDWPFWAALLLVAVGSPLLGALVDRLVVRPFFNAPRLILTVVLIGAGQALGGVQAAIPSIVAGQLAPPTQFRTPLGAHKLELGGVFFSGDDLAAAVAVVLIAAGLAAFFRYSDMGIAVRASAENGDRAALLGIPVRRVSTVVWMLAGLVSGIGIFLRGPLVGLPLDGQVGPVILLYALTAAVIARMESLPVALGAGVALGMLDHSVYFASGFRPNVANALILPILLVALLLQRRSKDRGRDTGVTTWQAVKEFRGVPPELVHLPAVRRATLGIRAAALAIAVAAPFVVGELDRMTLSLIVIYAIVGVSLVLLSGWAGQVSLGQFALVGVGAAVAGGLAADAGADFFVSLLLGGLAGAAVSVVIGVPALRVQGLLLAVTTLAFATNMQSFFLDRRYFTWVLPEPSNVVERPRLWQRIDVHGDTAFYFLCLVVLGLAMWLAHGMRTSRTGRVLIATRDNERSAQSYGVPLNRTRLAAFAMSGFIAAVAGGLLAYRLGAVDSAVFSPAESINVFAMAVIGGLTSIPGAIAGAIFVIGSSKVLTVEQGLMVNGIGIIVLLKFLPGGLAEAGYRARDAFLRRVAAKHDIAVPSLVADGLVVDDADEPAPTADIAVPADGRTVLLRCDDVSVAYDRVQVLFGVDLEVYEGEIVALLGTNGAGKSTLLRAVSGLVQPTSGRITFAGDDVTGDGPGDTVRKGIVQMPGGRAVFPTLTVAENLRAAAWAYRRDAAHVDAATAAVLQRFPRLQERIDQLAGNLSGGEQQMLGVGMAFIAKPRLLMIDELSLGLAPSIVEGLLEMVRAIHAQGTTVILVEQSVNVALTVAERAVFMEKGQVRFSGPTADLLQRDDIMRAVFLAGTVTDVGDGERTLDASPDVVLAVEDLQLAFGGITAVDGVTFDLHRGEILGLIGPNGAGKTTIFDLVSGYLTPDSGTVALAGEDVTSWSPDRRALAGLGRSFQDARIFPSLTVAENIALALERHLAVRDHLAAALHLPANGIQEEHVTWTVHDLVELMGLGAYRRKLVRELSTGTRRIVDLAMALAHDPLVLILDEPSSGIAQAETEALIPVLRRIQRETECSMLVIEHDMPLISTVSDRMLALEIGAVIAEGTPSEVLEHPRVVAAYLGTDERIVQRSGEVVLTPVRRRAALRAR